MDNKGTGQNKKLSKEDKPKSEPPANNESIERLFHKIPPTLASISPTAVASLIPNTSVGPSNSDLIEVESMTSVGGVVGFRTPKRNKGRNHKKKKTIVDVDPLQNEEERHGSRGRSNTRDSKKRHRESREREWKKKRELGWNSNFGEDGSVTTMIIRRNAINDLKGIGKITEEYTSNEPNLNTGNEIVKEITEEIPKVTEVPFDEDEENQREIRQRIKRDHLRNDMFGFTSKLTEQRGFIWNESIDTFLPNLGDNLSSMTFGEEEKDMTWIRELSQSENKRGSRSRSKTRKREMMADGPETKVQKSPDVLLLLWTFLLLGGRMPFNFSRSRNSKNIEETIECTFDRCRRRYYIFLATTLALLVVTILALSSFFRILLKEEDIDDPLLQTEKLLFQISFIPGLVFISTLILATVSSFIVLTSGDSMAKYITEWNQVVDEFNCNATAGIQLVTSVTIVLTVGEGLYQFLTLNLSNQSTPFIEGVHFMTTLVFGTIDNRVILHDYVNLAFNFTLMLSIYATYSSRVFVLLIVVYAKGITNLANEWNLRLRFILRHINLSKNESTLWNLMQNLNYQKMFDQHQMIVKLTKDMSILFGGILLTFYAIMSLVISGELLEIALFLVGNTTAPFNSTVAEIVGYKYSVEFENKLNTVILLCQTVFIFLIISLYLCETGTTIMDALYHIKLHSHMNFASTHQRDFMLSLVMSFSPKRAYGLTAGRLLEINRSSMFGFFAIMMYFFSVMIQTRIPRLLSVPIVFPCVDNPEEICMSVTLIKTGEVEKARNESLMGVVKVNSSKTFITSTITSLSTPFPCKQASAVLPGLFYKCGGVEMWRLHSYNRDGSQKRLQGNTETCMFDPYPASGGPYYDCFGNFIKFRDDCGILNFGNRMGPEIVTKRFELYPNNQRLGKFITCWEFDADYGFPPVPSSGQSDSWWPCGIPRWIAHSACHSNRHTIPGDILSTFNLRTWRTALQVILQPFGFDQQVGRACTPIDQLTAGNTTSISISTGVYIDAPIIAFTDDYLPIPVPPDNRYFPFFNPILLKEETRQRNFFIYYCNVNTGRRQRVALNPDSCGGLRFDRNEVFLAPGGSGRAYQCYVQNVCTVTGCNNFANWERLNSFVP